MVLSRGLHPSLCGALVVVATEAMAMAMAITVAATATAMQEVALPRQGNVMALCDANKARESVADNAGTDTTAE